MRDQSRANPGSLTFPAYSCLWAPLTDSAGGPSVLVAVSTERSQPAHLTPQQGKRSVANERQEFTSHLGVAGERPLCRRCSNGQPAADRRVWGFGPCFCFCHYCATVEQKISEPEKETMNLPLKFMVPCWGVLDIYFLSFLYSVHWLFKCILHKQRSKIIHTVPFIRYVLILQRNWVAELKWFPLSYNVILIFFFSSCCLVYLQKQLLSREWVGGLRRKMFSSKQVYGSYFALIDCESLSAWTPKQSQEEKVGGKEDKLRSEKTNCSINTSFTASSFPMLPAQVSRGKCCHITFQYEMAV